MEPSEFYPNYQVAYCQPKLLTPKAIANEIFIEERTFCFVTGYYLNPYRSNKAKLIDCTMGGEDAHKNFLKCAIPTAVFLDTTNKLTDKTSKIPYAYPKKEQVVEAMQDLGMNLDDNIVLYCQPHLVHSMTRVYHILNSHGFTDVSILDGGLFNYIKQGLPTAPGVDYTGSKSVIKYIKEPTAHLIMMDEIVEFALKKKPNMQLFDFRDSESFNGRDPNPVPGCRQGHVPGAINTPAQLFLNSDDTFKTASEIIKIFESNGINWNKDIAVMCKGGIAATVGYMAFSIIDHKGMRLYDGSWIEYGSNDTPSSSYATDYPILMPQTMAPVPQFCILSSGDYYMALQNDQENYPTYLS